MEYEKLLDRAIERLPTKVEGGERFEIPNVRGHIQGNKTVLSNFTQIADTLGRPPQHLLKFITKELATPGEIKNNLVFLGRKVSAALINEKVEQYASIFVVCKECTKPDTLLKKEGNIMVIQCEACGAKYPIKAKI